MRVQEEEGEGEYGASWDENRGESSEGSNRRTCGVVWNGI